MIFMKDVQNMKEYLQGVLLYENRYYYGILPRFSEENKENTI